MKVSVQHRSFNQREVEYVLQCRLKIVQKPKQVETIEQLFNDIILRIGPNVQGFCTVMN